MSAVSDTTLKQLTSDIERDLLFHIILNMRHRKISVGEAQHLAQEFLALLPAKDKEGLLSKLSALAKTYIEVQQVYVKYAEPYKEEERQKTLVAVRDFIEKGKTGQTIEAAKGGG